jgi:hypothetical protein
MDTTATLRAHAGFSVYASSMKRGHLGRTAREDRRPFSAPASRSAVRQPASTRSTSARLEREADAAADRWVAATARGAVSPAFPQTEPAQGGALPPATRSQLEAHFGHDFSRICIHCDGEAARAADALSARAFTIGNDIYFSGASARAGGTVDPHTLAHEVAHVVQQQRSGHATVQAQGPAGAAPLGPIDQARSDVVAAITYAVERLQSVISDRGTTPIVPHDVDDALCRFFPGFGPDRLEDILARVQPMIAWVPQIPAYPVPRPAPAGFRDAALLNLVTYPAQAMVHRDLPSMAPGDDYIALFPDWYSDPSLQATRFLHEVMHYSWPGMHHTGIWDNAFAWQGLISSIGGLTMGAVVLGMFPPCP